MSRTLIFIALALAITTADAGTLLPAGTRDQAPSRLVALPAPATPIERKPVAFAWALDPQAEIVATTPYVAESRDWYVVADAAELRRGIAIDTTAPGAVIRVSPADGVRPVTPAHLRVLKDGRLIPQPETFQRANDAAQLKAAGMDVPDGSAIVQLAEVHGDGRFQLQLPQASGRHLVHVFEPNSDIVLKAQAGRTLLLAGDTLEVAAELQRGHRKLGGGDLQGELVAPDGQRYPLSFRDGSARLPAPLAAGDAPGLWEVQLFAGRLVDGRPVQREARTVVEISRPTAKLSGEYSFDAAGLRFQLPLLAASPGRYEVRGTLYATARDGVARPVAHAQSAAWFDAGAGRLTLSFAGAGLPAGYGAPFELRQLELKDQGRMGTLETRELAARESGSARPAPVRERLAER